MRRLADLVDEYKNSFTQKKSHCSVKGSGGYLPHEGGSITPWPGSASGQPCYFMALGAVYLMKVAVSPLRPALPLGNRVTLRSRGLFTS